MATCTNKVALYGNRSVKFRGWEGKQIKRKMLRLKEPLIRGRECGAWSRRRWK